MEFKLLFILIISNTLFSTPLPTLQHAKIYKDQNISDWVMSEKLDGIRGYWDGDALYTKHGTKLFPPAEFTANFPPFALDGELWSKRQDFEYVQSTVLKHNGAWQNISYNIFEVPKAKDNFLIRLQKATYWFQEHPNSHVHIITQHPCVNQTTLLKYLETVIAKGGEGIMIKNPTLAYFQGRTLQVLKVKKAHDMEGEVIAINYRKGTKVLKSLTLQLKSGTTFNLGNGFTKEQRNTPPKISTVVTFKHYGFTKNSKPKFASYLRTRKTLQH